MASSLTSCNLRTHFLKKIISLWMCVLALVCPCVCTVRTCLLCSFHPHLQTQAFLQGWWLPALAPSFMLPTLPTGSSNSWLHSFPCHPKPAFPIPISPEHQLLLFQKGWLWISDWLDHRAKHIIQDRM